MGYHCPLSRLVPVDKPDPEEVKRDGWREQGILVVNVDDDRLDWAQRGWIDQIGQQLYGKRGGTMKFKAGGK